MAHDPVCGMGVNSPSQYFIEFEGNRYEFCSESCRTKFDESPHSYKHHRNYYNNRASYNINSQGFEKLKIPIIGLTCAACVTRIEKELIGAEGVINATVDLAS